MRLKIILFTITAILLSACSLSAQRVNQRGLKMVKSIESYQLRDMKPQKLYMYQKVEYSYNDEGDAIGMTVYSYNEKEQLDYVERVNKHGVDFNYQSEVLIPNTDYPNRGYEIRIIGDGNGHIGVISTESKYLGKDRIDVLMLLYDNSDNTVGWCDFCVVADRQPRDNSESSLRIYNRGQEILTRYRQHFTYEDWLQERDFFGSYHEHQFVRNINGDIYCGDAPFRPRFDSQGRRYRYSNRDDVLDDKYPGLEPIPNNLLQVGIDFGLSGVDMPDDWYGLHSNHRYYGLGEKDPTFTDGGIRWSVKTINDERGNEIAYHTYRNGVLFRKELIEYVEN